MTSTALPRLSSRQQQRSAGSTIAGYLYQFERSVVEILDLEPGQQARVEGIEDVDLWGNQPKIIQVKYYESQRWSLKSVRGAVYEMLKSFAAGSKVSYILYVYCGSGETPPTRLSTDELRECLTYRPQDKPIELLYEEFDECDIAEFAAVFEIRTGVSLEDQRKITNAKIAAVLGCDEEEAELLHRMRVVHFLQEKAVNKDEADRIITKEQLLKILSVRDIFYNNWHKQVIGHEKFLIAAVRRLKKLNFNTSNSYRGVLVDVTDDCVDDVAELAIELAKDMTGSARQRTTSAKPWSLILRCTDELVLEVKNRLIDAKIHFNDGYEHIRFSADIFATPAVVNSVGGGSRLSKASYSLRLVSEKSFRETVAPDHQLAQLLVLSNLEDWHYQATRAAPTSITGLSIKELTVVLKGVTT